MTMRKLGFINSILAAVALLLALVMPAAAADPPGVVPALVRQDMRPGESITVTKYVTLPSIAQNPDIYFLVDSTGSMGPSIDNVKTNADAIMASVLAAQPTAQFGVGNYKDFPINVSSPTPSNAYAFQHQQGITANTTAVTNAIANWSAYAGGDGSEGWLYALTKIATDPAIGWRTGSTRIIVIIGDAPAHDPVPMVATGLSNDITEATTTAALLAAHIKVVAVSLTTGGYDNAVSGLGLDGNPIYNYTPNGKEGYRDYLIYPPIPGGTPGQASRIAAATGGVYLLSPTAAQVAASILSGLQSLKTDVWATVVADPGLSVTLTPPVLYAVPSGTTVNFTETITLTGTTVGSQYNATVSFWANSYPKTGTLIGTEKIEVVYPAAPSISVTKAGVLDMTVVAPKSQADAGDRINYTFTVQNTGNVTLTNVTVSDVPALTTGPVPASVASLAPGASTTFTGSYTLTQADINTGKVDNTATATGTPPTGPAVTGTGTASVLITAAPSISVTKTGALDMTVVAPGTQADVGDKINYTFTVKNTGNVTLTSVTVSDVPALTTGPVPASVASLAPGASTTFTGTYTLTQADINTGKVDDTATATGTPPTGPAVTDTGKASVPIAAAPSISVTKNGVLDMTVVAPSTQANAGDRINYTFTVTNTGNVTLTNVTVTDPKVTVVGGPIASLAPGASTTFTGSYTLTQADINAGKVDNTATATGTPPTGPAVTGTGTASVPIPAATICDGRMTGGGSVFTSNGVRVTHGFELHCDPAKLPNNLEVNWGKGNNFHLEKLITANCSDDPSILPNPPAAGFDTYEGSGMGRYNSKSGATIEFKFTDAGEPGKDDTATITIWDAKGNLVLSVSGKLEKGNHQAHKS